MACILDSCGVQLKGLILYKRCTSCAKHVRGLSGADDGAEMAGMCSPDLLSAGKLCIVIFAAWGGDNGGIIAGLAVCTIMQTIVGACADLMQDFKTGLLVSMTTLRMDVKYSSQASKSIGTS